MHASTTGIMVETLQQLTSYASADHTCTLSTYHPIQHLSQEKSEKKTMKCSNLRIENGTIFKHYDILTLSFNSVVMFIIM